MAAAWNRAAKFRLALSNSFPDRHGKLWDTRGRFKSSFRTWPFCRVGKDGEFHRLFVLGRDAELVRRC
jgi:hypothetical protein